jgi:hypothetical protein
MGETLKRILRLSGIATGLGIATVVTTAAPALADVWWETGGTHVGDICTVSCKGSASFVHDGDHLYVWDNAADGRSAVVIYFRSDTGDQKNAAWNHFGANTVLDHNMNIPEGGWIKYHVCLGDYAAGKYDTCSSFYTENAG